jgi:hypothetical protein
LLLPFPSMLCFVLLSLLLVFLCLFFSNSSVFLNLHLSFFRFLFLAFSSRILLQFFLFFSTLFLLLSPQPTQSPSTHLTPQTLPLYWLCWKCQPSERFETTTPDYMWPKTKGVSTSCPPAYAIFYSIPHAFPLDFPRIHFSPTCLNITRHNCNRYSEDEFIKAWSKTKLCYGS